MQRGVADRGPAHEDRRHVRYGRQRPGPSHVDLDRLELGGHLLRRELVGGRPTGRAREEAKTLLFRNRVDLDHDAIGLVVELVPSVPPLLDVGDHLVDAVDAADVRVDREAEPLDQLE